MKVTYHAMGGALDIEFDAADAKSTFEFVASVQELFNEHECGKCKSQRIRCDVREFDGNRYYKLRCDDCDAVIDFGQHKVGGTLFIKRRDKDNRPLPDSGWYIYDGRRREDEEQPRPAQKPQAPPRKPFSGDNPGGDIPW